MATVTGSFTLSAWILGDRWRHSRQHDHFGAESDLYITLSSRIGPYAEDTPVHFVLADLVDRLLSLESSAKVFGSFTLDAYIWPYFFRLEAIIQAPQSGSFTLEAWLNRGGSFTLDAVIQGGGSFVLQAMIV